MSATDVLRRERDAARAEVERLREENEQMRSEVKRMQGEFEEGIGERERLRDSMELAWGIIANAGGGDWDTQHPTWKQAAIRWRDEHWHTFLERRAALAGAPSEPRREQDRALAERVRSRIAAAAYDAGRADLAAQVRALDLDALMEES